jgi:exopolyphosphatase/guanosine-5'-triphosphate,3'-diphosphate pyrophosphatase
VIQGCRRAIIDIGSNSVRLVIFGGAPRAPVVLYNEKLMAGLGRAVMTTGALAEDAMALALGGLARFQAIIAAMNVQSLDAVATAAVRDSANRAEFIARARAIGLDVRILSGEEEALAAGYGVLSAIPDADGLVADLGGGSLELVRVSAGKLHDRVSLPIGILKVAGIRAGGAGKLARHIKSLLTDSPWIDQGRGLPLYLVGGSWRSLSRIHMHRTGFPLPVLGHYVMPTEDVRPLAEAIGGMDKAAIKAVPGMPSSRVPMVADAAALLAALVDATRPAQLVTCAFGLREGLLYQALTPEERNQDPLIEGVRFVTASQQQTPGYGEALLNWTDGLFGDEPHSWRRLRHAVCLLHGTGWASNPDFRALGGEELALHGNWTGVTPAERAMMGQALFTGMGGGIEPALLAQLAAAEPLERARHWGLAIRLAQRLSGGAPVLLEQTRLSQDVKGLRLSLPARLSCLAEPGLRRRLDTLAAALGAPSAGLAFA